MFERMANGWEMARQSWEVLKLDKELLLFPLLSGIACLLVVASFAAPILVNPEAFQGVLNAEEPLQNPLAMLALFAFYFVNYFVIVFFNSALVACAIIRFRGGDPTVRDGLRAAWSRLPQIVAWALVSATVGVVLRVIESRSERVGQIVAGLMGMAWTATTYFVVPVLVVEKLGPVDAVKRSLAVLRRTWGESLSANFSTGFFVFLGMILAAVPLVLGFLALSAGNTALGILLVVCGVVSMIIVNLIGSALNAIQLGALYLYAADGKVPSHYDAALLQQAFRHEHAK